MESKIVEIRDDEWSKIYAVPVTLRQVIDAKIELNSEFGIDDAEKQSLMDDETILRATFGVEMDTSYNISEIYGLETYCSRIGQNARWENALQTYYSSSGSKDRTNASINRNKTETLIRDVVGPALGDILVDAAKPFEEWVKEIESENN